MEILWVHGQLKLQKISIISGRNATASYVTLTTLPVFMWSINVFITSIVPMILVIPLVNIAINFTWKTYQGARTAEHESRIKSISCSINYNSLFMFHIFLFFWILFSYSQLLNGKYREEESKQADPYFSFDKSKVLYIKNLNSHIFRSARGRIVLIDLEKSGSFDTLFANFGCSSFWNLADKCAFICVRDAFLLVSCIFSYLFFICVFFFF